jgi:flagellar hook-associated protein 3 FlgL
MSIDRVATNSSSQYMLSQIMRANNALNVSQAQVASGMVSTDYAGIGDKTAALEAARSASDRANAYMTSNQLAQTQTDLQDTQLTNLAGLATQLQKALQTAEGNSDGTNLIDTAKTVFDQAKAILNATDANGNYIYGGQKSNTPPFTASDISALNSQPIANFFVNGNTAKSVQIGDGQTQKIGVLASDIGTQLMSALNTLYQQDNPPGALSGPLTSAQVDNLSNALTPTTQAVTVINAAAAANGDAYTTLKDSITNQQAVKNLYDGFVSDIQDVDMAKAITTLNSNQTALQAALQVTARLGQLSLLNYLPPPTG